MNFNVVIAMMETAYYKFKDQFPDEEPFFRITCTRKYGRSDRYKSWRPKNFETRVVFPDKKTEVSETQIPDSFNLDKVIPEPYPQLSRKQQDELEKGRTDVVDSSRVMGKYVRPKKNKLVDADIRTVEVTKVPYDACVDLRMDDPLSVGVFKYCIDTATMLLKEIRTEYKILLEDPLFKTSGAFITTDDVNDISSIEENLEKIKKIKEKEEEMKNKVLQIEETLPKLSRDSEELEGLNATIKMAFKETSTVNEIVSKYIDVQKKLNDLKSYAVPLMKKYNEMPFTESITKYGFIATVKEFIEYLHQNTADDYVSELRVGEIGRASL